MIEYALFDADGVLIAKRQKYFSQRLIDDFNIKPEDAKDFVIHALSPAIIGLLDMSNELSKYLAKWGINKTTAEMFTYWWNAESSVDNRTLQIVDLIRSPHLKTYLATDQEKYRAEYILHQLGLGQHFDGTFFSCDLGAQKDNANYWEKVIESLKTDPFNILFWDDDQKNVNMAANFGITAKLYKDFEQFKEETMLLIHSDS